MFEKGMEHKHEVVVVLDGTNPEQTPAHLSEHIVTADHGWHIDRCEQHKLWMFAFTPEADCPDPCPDCAYVDLDRNEDGNFVHPSVSAESVT